MNAVFRIPYPEDFGLEIFYSPIIIFKGGEVVARPRCLGLIMNELKEGAILKPKEFFEVVLEELVSTESHLVGVEDGKWGGIRMYLQPTDWIFPWYITTSTFRSKRACEKSGQERTI